MPDLINQNVPSSTPPSSSPANINLTPQHNTQMPDPQPPKPKKWLWIIIFLVFIIVALVISFTPNKKAGNNIQSPTQTPVASVSGAEQNTLPASALPIEDNSLTADDKTYTNSEYLLSFNYPADWSITTDTQSSSEPVYEIVLSKDNSKMLTVGLWKTSAVTPASLEEEQQDLDKKSQTDKTNIMKINLRISGNQAFKYEFGTSSQSLGSSSASVVANGNFYKFVYWGNSPAEFSKVLNSIKIN